MLQVGATEEEKKKKKMQLNFREEYRVKFCLEMAFFNNYENTTSVRIS
jgi:hypothetical protein